ncbi:hypothetical protein GCM10009595_18390 [Falsarthrobacter nasiphocae]
MVESFQDSDMQMNTDPAPMPATDGARVTGRLIVSEIANVRNGDVSSPVP